jgi:hypothetical protein
MSDTTPELTTLAGTHEPSGRPQLVDTQSLVFWVFVGVIAFSGLHLFHWVTANPLVAPAIAWLAIVQWAIYAGIFLVVV